MEMEKIQVAFSLPLGSTLPDVEEYQRMLRMGWIALEARYQPPPDVTAPRQIMIHFERHGPTTDSVASANGRD